jgi:hypothetical protein
MDPNTIRIICAAVALAFGVLIFMRRRSKHTE